MKTSTKGRRPQGVLKITQDKYHIEFKKSGIPFWRWQSQLTQNEVDLLDRGISLVYRSNEEAAEIFDSLIAKYIMYSNNVLKDLYVFVAEEHRKWKEDSDRQMKSLLSRMKHKNEIFRK